jgi:hypothetical protein
MRTFCHPLYNIKTQRAEVVSLLVPNVPWLHAGTVKGGIYRIVPRRDALLPDNKFPNTDRELIWSVVLGVNLNVQPALPTGPRVANYPEESSEANESDDSEGTGFVFHQIGMLEEWMEAPENGKVTEKDFGADDEWSPTEFGVVVRILRNGAAGGIYIIYNFYQEDASYKRGKWHDLESWGTLGDVAVRMSVARIADSMSELSFGRPLRPVILADYPIELVRVVMGREDSLIRATVVRDRSLILWTPRPEVRNPNFAQSWTLILRIRDFFY